MYNRISDVSITISVLLSGVLPELASGVGPIFDEGDPRTLTDRCYSYAVAVADLDADGHNDVVAIHNQLGDFACFNDGDGNFICQYLGDTGARGWGLTVADYDGDGDLDILPDVGTSNGVWFRNEGARVFTVLPPVVEHVIAAGYLNEDEFVDVISRAGANTIHLNNGDGTFQLSQTLPSGVPGGPAIGDVDDDGDNDLAIGGRLWLNDGTGTFSDSGQDLSIPGGGPNYDGTRLFKDINNDNKLDLVVANYFDGCYAFLNEGSGSLSWTGETLLPAIVIAVGDVDSDGNLDLVMDSLGLGYPVYLGDGQGGFEGPAQTLPPGNASSLHAVALGYLNDDLAIDVVVGAAGPDTCGTPLAYMNVSAEPIPTVSEFGLIVMSLLLLAAGTLVFGRRRSVSV